MRTLNRCAVVVTPKQPFLDWLHGIDPWSLDIQMADLQDDSSVYLFPECKDAQEIKRHVKKACQRIFEQELESRDRIAESWPADRSFALFQKWFDFRSHSMVFDVTEELAPLELSSASRAFRCRQA